MVSSIHSATRPSASAAAMPPAASISPNRAHALLGQLVGEALDVPGAAGRVGHPAQVGLLGGQQLDVAGHPPGEVGGQAPGGVVRQHGDRLGSADGGGEGGDGAAQQVHPRIVAGDHPPRGDRQLDGAALLGGHAAHLAHPGPQPAQRAQPGDGHELVGVGRHPERDLAEHRLGVDAGRFEVAQVLHAGGDRRRPARRRRRRRRRRRPGCRRRWRAPCGTRPARWPPSRARGPNSGASPVRAAWPRASRPRLPPTSAALPLARQTSASASAAAA